MYFSREVILLMFYTYQAVTMLRAINDALMYFIAINSGQSYTVLCRNRSEREHAEGNRLNSITKNFVYYTYSRTKLYFT